MTSSVPIAEVSRNANSKSPVKLVEKQQHEKRHVHVEHGRIARARGRFAISDKATRPVPMNQADAADGAENHRRAEIGIRRLPTEKVIVESRDT